MERSKREVCAEAVVVGAGPAGCVLSALLARSGVETVLVERHGDLDREFRGYLFQPLVLRLFDEMDLLEPILALEHEEVRRPRVFVGDDAYRVLDLSALPPPYDFGLLMEQPPLLETIIERASAHDSFTYLDGTAVRGLRRDGDRVVGVDAIDHGRNESVSITSRLVVGADGRYSTVRRAAGIDPGLLESEVELLWFKLPASVADAGAQARVGEDGLLLSFGLGGGVVQLGWFIPKGSYPTLRERGIEAFHERLCAVDPALRDVLPEHLPGFEECTLLRVEPGMSEAWVRDGLLLVGDAAHVASPIGGQGNGLAISDAVVAHAVVMEALRNSSGGGRGDGDGGEGPLPASSLARYESIRRPAVEEVMALQRRGERALTLGVRHGGSVPRALRLPLVRGLLWAAERGSLLRGPGRTFALGPEPVSVDAAWFDPDR